MGESHHSMRAQYLLETLSDSRPLFHCQQALVPAGQVHLRDAGVENAEGPLSMNMAPFALMPDGMEPQDAAAYDLVVAPPAAGADRRYLAPRLFYTNAAYRAQMHLAAMHQSVPRGVVPDFQSREFVNFTVLPCPLPAGAVLPVGVPGGAPVVPAVAESVAFGV